MSGGPNYPIAALYVGNLHTDVTEEMLFQKFLSAGPVKSVRLCVDTENRFLGYAYVNFLQLVDAERALNTMNFNLLKGRPIHIMWSQRDPSLRYSNIGNVFIKNLDKSIDSKTLCDTFSAFGNILSCKVAADEEGVSLGYGFIHFESEEVAENVIARVNGKLIKGKKVYVGKFIPREGREKMEAKTGGFVNVYIKNFGEDLDDEKLRELFEKYGKITSAKVMVDASGKSKCFGFVSFEEPEHAEKAVEDLNDKELNGKPLYVERAIKKSERMAELKGMFEQRASSYQGMNLFVKNLDRAIDDERLRKEFSSCGTITSAKVMTDSSQRSKGFGFVCFSSPEEATRAIKDMNGRVVVSKPIYVALAEQKEDRRARLASKHMQCNAGMQMQQQLGQMCPPANSEHSPPMPQRSRGCLNPAQMPPVHANAALHKQRKPLVKAISRHATTFLQQVNTNRAPRHQAVSASQNVAMYTRMNTRPITEQQPAVAATAVASGGKVPTAGPARVGAASPTMPAAPVNQGHPAASSTRNSSQPGSVPQASVQQAVHIQGQEPLTASVLAQYNAQEQKETLRECLCSAIRSQYPNMAETIAEMLLENDNLELLHMLNNREALKAKVQEAFDVLFSRHANDILTIGRSI